jgi:Flp pilus assembly pilin Flp
MRMPRLMTKIRAFLRSTNGAVTVDWVVLTAFVVTLLGAGYGLMRESTSTVTAGIGSYMTNFMD